MKNNRKIIQWALFVFTMIIVSVTSTGAYSYFTFGEKIYGQISAEGIDENITQLPIYYVDGLIKGNIKINLTKFIYDNESLKIQLLNKDESPVLDSSNNEVILDVTNGSTDGTYTCEFNNDIYKAIKYKIIGYSYNSAEYLTSNEMEKENIMFKRTLTINYYDKSTDDLSVSAELSYKDITETKEETFPKSHVDDNGRWRKVQLSYDTFCEIGSSSSYNFIIGSNTYTLDTDDIDTELWIKNGKVYDSEPPEEHNITFIIDSNLNNYSGENLFDLSNFPGIAVSSGIATKVDGKYTFSTTYEEVGNTKCGFGFKINGDKFINNIRNIKIPTWDEVPTEGTTTTNYSYDTEHFNNLSDGGVVGNPPLTVSQDSQGNVTIIIRIIEKMLK